MKLRLLVCAAVATVGGLAIAAELESGLQPGASIGAFNVVKCSGAADDGVDVGTELCYRCRYGARPMVMVFSRQSDDALVALTKQLDEEVAEHSDKKLAAFVSLMGEDRDALEARAKAIGSENEIAAVPVVVPVEFENGPADYGINPDAQVTVIIASKSKVVANHAIGEDGLTEEAIAAILADVEKLVE